MQLLINVGDLRIMQLLTDISLQIGCGELQQLNNRHTTEPSVDDYFNIIRAKTSFLFAASASMGAMVAKTNQDIEKGLYDYGLHLGNAFQLIDDALDYCSDAKTIGKNIGDDLADGKATLPLLYVLEKGNPTQQNLIKESLKKGTLDYLPEILEAIKETNAIEYTKNIATQEMNLATAALNILSDSSYKEALIKLAQYAVHRQH
jgi:octaprenyl-diphosphate synthase